MPVGARRQEGVSNIGNDEVYAGFNLISAAAQGSIEQIQKLLEAQADPNFRDYENKCALHVAAGFGTWPAVKFLIERGADVNATDCWGQTPLDQAIRGGHFKAERLLKDGGAKLQKKSVVKRAATQGWEIKRSDVQVGDQISLTLKSVVHRATWNGIDVVAKFPIAESQGSTELEDEMLNEVSLLSTIRHPDLVMFLGCCVSEVPIMFISEFIPGGDLETYYEQKSKDGRVWKSSKTVVTSWSMSVLRALWFLHSMSPPLLHRDLKPLNILLTSSLKAKVADFGLGKVLHPYSSPIKSYESSGKNDRCAMTGGVGSWRYMAPEVARHEGYTEKIDVYAFGLILYFMSCGLQPFREYGDLTEVLDSYAQGKEPRPISSECPAVFRPIMEAAWHVVPAKRPSAAELVQILTERRSSHSCNCSVM